VRVAAAAVLEPAAFEAALADDEEPADEFDEFFSEQRLSDELNHASIIDGCRLSKAQVVVYRHADSEHLQWCLRRQGEQGRQLIVTDAVFSMDGDVAPLRDIVELAQEHGARTIVDAAHAAGVKVLALSS